MFAHIHFMWFILFAVAISAMAIKRAPFLIWTLVLSFFGILFFIPFPIVIFYIGISILFVIPKVRNRLLTPTILKLVKKYNFFAPIEVSSDFSFDNSEVWIEADYFKGELDWDKLKETPSLALNDEELKFLNEKTNDLCNFGNKPENEKTREFPSDVLHYLKNNNFLGITIPKNYNGLGFSVKAYSDLSLKLASCSTDLGVAISVPNSTGPTSLIMQFGTKDQKEYYLPRFAGGLEIPCFAGTQLINAEGVLFKGTDGKIYIRLNFEKRKVKLAQISSILGLIFNLKDPEFLLGKKEEVGMTCGLINLSTNGVSVDKASSKLGGPFYYAEVEGEAVVISINDVIGGSAGIGLGLQIVRYSSLINEGIALPAYTTSICKLLTRTTSAYSVISAEHNSHFNQMSGTDEALAKMAGLTYLLDNVRKFTLIPFHNNIKSSVIASICKYKFTEISDIVTSKSMDILNRHEARTETKNFLTNFYLDSPLNLMKDRSHIFERNLFIFNNGVHLAHPYFKHIRKALTEESSVTFDKYFFDYAKNFICNFIQMISYSFTRGYLSGIWGNSLEQKAERKLNWATIRFAVWTDIIVIFCRPKFKYKSRSSEHLANILSTLYVITANLKNYKNSNKEREEQLYFSWILNYSLNELQKDFEALINNFDGFWGSALRILVAPFTRANRLNSPFFNKEDLDMSIALTIEAPGFFRDKVTEGIYYSSNSTTYQNQLEQNMVTCFEASKLRRRIFKLIDEGRLSVQPWNTLLEQALMEKMVTQTEIDLLKRSDSIRLTN